MLVSTENLHDIISRIEEAYELSLDTETTGLYSFKDDSLFSIVISTEGEDFYFNFQDYPLENIKGLPRELVYEQLRPIFADETKLYYLQNAKFDLHMLAREGLFVKGSIYDLMFLDRIHFNQHQSYRLADITKRWGEYKDDKVWEYVKENGLITKTDNEELGKSDEKPHFDQVPFSLMQPYAEQDGKATLSVGKKILKAIETEDASIMLGIPKQMQVVENEAKLIHTLFRMENRGILIDIEYCWKALKYYQNIIDMIKSEFKLQTGLDFVKGTTVFEEVFASESDKWEKTQKGQWRWDADMLETFENPIARLVIDYSEAKKQSEYFANFLYYADSRGVLHPDFQQSGTVTSRLSCREPNLQNLTNPDKYEGEKEASLYPVRRAFIPRDGYFFAMVDFSQMEFRVMLDMAKANQLINEVLNGHDVHTATANVSGTSRKEAKTTNFLTAFGGGVVKLATNLFNLKGGRHQLGAIYKKMFKWRLSEDEQKAWPSVTDELRRTAEPIIKKAYDIQQSIFRAAPEIKDLLKAIQQTATQRGYVRNWLGRRYQFNDKRWCYRAPNHIIQGGSAEVTKIAMNRVDAYLSDKESNMIVSIHDELVIEVKYGEEYVVEEVKRIMENIYPYKRLPLTAEIEYSYDNLADKSEWPPPHLSSESETRNSIQTEATEALSSNTESVL
jgi:DNA polymerase-1